MKLILPNVTYDNLAYSIKQYWLFSLLIRRSHVEIKPDLVIYFMYLRIIYMRVRKNLINFEVYIFI